MSEASRRRWLFVHNRLEELRAKHDGPSPSEELPAGPACDPSWGPVGSLAKRTLDPLEYEHLLALHNDALALERSRAEPSAEPVAEPEPQVPQAWQRAPW